MEADSVTARPAIGHRCIGLADRGAGAASRHVRVERALCERQETRVTRFPTAVGQWERRGCARSWLRSAAASKDQDQRRARDEPRPRHAVTLTPPPPAWQRLYVP